LLPCNEFANIFLQQVVLGRKAAGLCCEKGGEVSDTLFPLPAPTTSKKSGAKTECDWLVGGGRARKLASPPPSQRRRTKLIPFKPPPIPNNLAIQVIFFIIRFHEAYSLPNVFFRNGWQFSDIFTKLANQYSENFGLTTKIFYYIYAIHCHF
jgi:hypothetical protein